MVIPGSPMAAGHDSTRWCFGQRSAVGVPESEDRWPSCKEDLGGERPGVGAVRPARLNRRRAMAASVPGVAQREKLISFSRWLTRAVFESSAGGRLEMVVQLSTAGDVARL